MAVYNVTPIFSPSALHHNPTTSAWASGCSSNMPGRLSLSALSVPPAWNPLFSGVHVALSLTSCKSCLKCHLSDALLLKTTLSEILIPRSLLYFSLFSTSHLLTCYIINLYLWLISLH